MDLKTWLEDEKGRSASLAEHIGVTPAAVSQWKTNGVPLAHMKAVRDFTGGIVTLEEMVPEAKVAGGEPQPPFPSVGSVIGASTCAAPESEDTATVATEPAI